MASLLDYSVEQFVQAFKDNDLAPIHGWWTGGCNSAGKRQCCPLVGLTVAMGGDFGSMDSEQRSPELQIPDVLGTTRKEIDAFLTGYDKMDEGNKGPDEGNPFFTSYTETDWALYRLGQRVRVALNPQLLEV